jgi:hypothetical protein
MLRKSFLLLATAGLLAFAFATLPVSSPIPGDSRAQRRQFLQSLKDLTPEARHTALRKWLDAERDGRQLRHERTPGTPRRLDLPSSPFGGEFAPAPDIGAYQTDPAVAFDGSQYLIVWSQNWTDIYGARVQADGTLLDEEGFQISNSGVAWWLSSVAFDGTNFFVVWDDWRGDDNDIYGARVSQSGSVLDEDGILVSTNTDDAAVYNPSVAFDGTNYLVVWEDRRNDLADIYGARVSTAGAVLDGSGISISATVSSQWAPRVAFDGTNYLVVWQDQRNSGQYDIYGARVNPSGQVLDPSGIAISTATNDQQHPALAFDGTNYLAVWQHGAGSDIDIYGSRVSPSGSVLDPGGIVMSDTTEDWESYPAVRFDGTDYLVAWNDENSGHVYGCEVSLASPPVVSASYDISGADRVYPALASGPVEGTAMVAYQSSSYVTLARLAVFDLTGDVGTVSIERPVASFLLPSWEIPPQAELKNYGSATRSFNAEFTITKGGSEVYSKTKTVLGLKAGEIRAVSFYPFELETGLFTSRCTTMLTDDGTKTNDSATAIFQGCDFMYFFDEDNHTEFSASTDDGWSWGPLSWSGWAAPAMDETIWGVGRDGDYDPNKDGRLVSPTFDVTRSNPSIAFQHNFDITDADDGGNFSYSTNGGSSWTLLEPVGGLDYSGTPAALGQKGWTGSSSGWKQSVFTIPVASGTFQVSWRFASDGSTNDHGWLIDEVAGVGFPVDLKAGRPPKPGAAINAVSLSSNPLRGQGLLTYNLVRACKVSIKLFDAGGRLVRPLATAACREGVNIARLDARGVNPGVYFVKLTGGSDVRTAKVIIE